MAKLEIDYSLPYEEAKKKYGRNGFFMSKDQYDAKAAEVAKANAGAESQEASPEDGNGMTVNGVDYSQPYEVSLAKHQEKNGLGAPFASKEDYESAKSRIYNQGTSPDVDDTKAIGATKEELDYMLQNGQISRDAYEKQLADLNTPEVQEEMAKGENKADETVWDSTNRDVDNSANNALTDSVAEVTTPNKNDTQEEGNSKNQYNKAMMSIWDAYRAGEISKETAGYFTIDAIATLAKNLGRSIGNVGAQFSGGTIDNGHDESKWGQRQNALLNEEIGKETESLGGAAGRQAESEILDLEAKKIRNAYTPAQLEQQIEMFKKDLENADINLDMAHSRTDLIKFIKSDKDYAKSPFKMGLVAYLTQAGAAGAANNASKTLGDAINWILTLAK